VRKPKKGSASTAIITGVIRAPNSHPKCLISLLPNSIITKVEAPTICSVHVRSSSSSSSSVYATVKGLQCQQSFCAGVRLFQADSTNRMLLTILVENNKHSLKCCCSTAVKYALTSQRYFAASARVPVSTVP
jgi:hypothetical protein